MRLVGLECLFLGVCRGLRGEDLCQISVRQVSRIVTGIVALARAIDGLAAIRLLQRLLAHHGLDELLVHGRIVVIAARLLASVLQTFRPFGLHVHLAAALERALGDRASARLFRGLHQRLAPARSIDVALAGFGAALRPLLHGRTGLLRHIAHCRLLARFTGVPVCAALQCSRQSGQRQSRISW